MSLTYTQYTTELALLTGESLTDVNFQAAIPGTIDYAEQRIYRELDLLTTVTRDSSASVTPNSRNFTLPESIGRFVVVNGINLYTPAGSTTTRNALVPASLEYLDFVWPSEAAANSSVVPEYFAMVTDQTVVFGPPPGSNYTAEVIGTIRPTPLSLANPTTFLSLFLPDLFVAASMIFLAGYMKNFGSQSDNPQLATSWVAQYDALKDSAMTEELRKKWSAASWSSKAASPAAVPQRG